MENNSNNNNNSNNSNNNEFNINNINNNSNDNANSNINEINQSKIIQFGEIKDDYDRAKLALVREFPMCFYPISKLFDCERDNGVTPPSSSAISKFKICQSENAHVNFCILSSFCPFEATMLMNCTNGAIPTENSKIPNKCKEIFKSFDNCLTRKTKEYEERGYYEHEEKTKVVYGDNIDPNSIKQKQQQE